MNKNEKGFSLVEGLLLILVVSFISFAGWYVYNSSNAKDEKATTTKSDVKKITEENKTETKISDDWLTYQAKGWGEYTVKLPNGTAFISNPDGPSIYTRSEIKPSSAQATVTEAQQGSDNPYGLFLIYSLNDAQHISPRGDKQGTIETYAGTKVQKYVYYQENEPKAIDIPKGATSYQYIVIKGDRALRVEYNTSDKTGVPLVEEMVKTIELM